MEFLRPLFKAVFGWQSIQGLNESKGKPCIDNNFQDANSKYKIAINKTVPSDPNLMERT